MKSVSPKLPVPTVPFNFLAVPQDYASARVVVLPVPFDSTASYVPGARFGPLAIIDASRQVELFDEELGCNPSEVGIYTFDELEPVRGNVVDTLAHVQAAVEKIVGDEKIPFTLGGEHSITVSVARALKKKFEAFTILQFDGHADLRDEWEGSKYSHACTARRLVEEGLRVVQVGVRALCEEERDFARGACGAGVKTFFAEKNLGAKAKEVLEACGGAGSERVYVSFDLDALDSSIMPAVGTPLPGGLLWWDALEILRAVCGSREVIGADVVEFSPLPGTIAPNFLAAHLAYKIIGYSWAKKKK